MPTFSMVQTGPNEFTLTLALLTFNWDWENETIGFVGDPRLDPSGYISHMDARFAAWVATLPL